MQLHDNRTFSLSVELQLIIYGKHSPYKHPKNAAIYTTNEVNEYWIEAPCFKSETMINGIKDEMHSNSQRTVWTIHPHKDVVKNFWGKVIEEKPQQGYVDGYTELKEIEGKKYAEIMISDGGMYFEFQYLDLETFTFLNTARWGGKF